MRSMTCYGRGEAQDENFIVSIDARGVNNRYRDINLHLPPSVRPLEADLKQKIMAEVHRGRLDLYFTVKIIQSPSQRLRIDYDLAREINDGMRNLKYDLELSGEVSIDTISRFKDVFQLEEEDLSETLAPSVTEALDKLIVSINQMKDAEGEAIRNDFEQRLNTVSDLRQQVADAADTVVEETRKKLESRIKTILGEQVVDEYRLEQEVSFLAERSDISEELVRLESHINQFRKTMDEKKSIGKKLDFILQEFNREVNTIASKSSKTAISATAIEMKAEIEKLREQVQNVE